MNAKLTYAKAVTIRSRLASGALVKVLAAEYGVSHDTIYKIRHGKIWPPPGCPITVWSNITDPTPHRCRRPVAAASGFCAHHEADRVRLGGAA